MRIGSKIYAYSRIPELHQLLRVVRAFSELPQLRVAGPELLFQSRAATFQSCQEMRQPAGSADSAQERVYTQ